MLTSGSRLLGSLAYYRVSSNGKLPHHSVHRVNRTKSSTFRSHTHKRGLFTNEQVQRVFEHLHASRRESLRPKDPPTPPVRRPDLDKFLDGPLDTDTEQTVLIDTKVPFLKTSIFSRWNGVIQALWELASDSISVSLNNWALRRFAPHIQEKMIDVLDDEVDSAFALVAEAIETSNISLLKDLLDPVLYSLLQDNFAEFVRLHDYRLAVREIKSKRVGMKITWKLPPFGNEVPSGLSLWGGNAIVYSQKAEGTTLKDARLWIMQAVGLNYALLKREQVVASTPPGIGGVSQMPIPERFNTPNHIKRRVFSHINQPLVGDVISLIKYLLAMRRLGFGYVLRRGTIEFEVAYGFECFHNLSVLPKVEEQVDEKAELAKSKEEKQRDAIERQLKYPELQNVSAPHLMLFSASYPLHPDGEGTVTPKWRISEIDGMRNLEKFEVGQLAQLSTLSPDEIDKQLPALRILSKDLFTKLGPKKEWYNELRRLHRVADHRMHHGTLDDPQELDTPLNELLKRSRLQKKRALDKGTLETPQAGSALGNIFDLAKELKDSQVNDQAQKPK